MRANDTYIDLYTRININSGGTKQVGIEGKDISIFQSLCLFRT
jgi:hypothetical protein